MIAGTVERRKHFGRHAAGFGQHRLDIVHAQVAEEILLPVPAAAKPRT